MRIAILATCPADGMSETIKTKKLDGGAVAIATRRVAIAETATIVLDAGPGMGERALTPIPDRHVVVEEQVAGEVPDAVAALDPSRPLTWISGSTSEIELNRVEGAHGPRILDVALASPCPPGTHPRTEAAQ